MPTITLNHGLGGKQMHEFIKNTIMTKLQNGILEKMDDSAILKNLKTNRLALTTDSYVVSPLIFPGGDIGRLCVCGTVNDLTTSGAKPYALTLAFIIEEGMDLAVLDTIIDSINKTAKEAQILIVTGDTKVVEKGKGDGIFINTSGIGFIDDHIEISTYNTKDHDDVLVTGPIGNHEIAMMKARNLIEFDLTVESDVRPLNIPIENLLKQKVLLHSIKDPTRGGLASALYEIVEHSKVDITLIEKDLPIDKVVQSVCSLVGFDPLYLANEGKFIITCPKESSQHIIKAFKGTAQIIGRAKKSEHPKLLMETKSGGIRKIGMLETMQLPRIC